MNEIPGPSPEERGDDPETNEPDITREKAPPENAELLRDAAGDIIGGVEDITNDEFILIGVGPIREPMPVFQLTPTETGDTAQYTELGVKREKQMAIESFTRSQCIDLNSCRIGFYPFSEGLMCTDIDMRVGVVIDWRLEKDPEYETSLKTQVILTLRYPDGKIKEVKSAKPAYEQMKKLQVPEAFVDLVERKIGGQDFRLGQYVDILGIEGFVGQVALFLDQIEYPEMVGVMLIGTVSDRIPRLFAVPISSLIPRQVT